MKFTKGLLIAAISATGASAAFNDFDVQEGVIGADTTDNLFTADKITGNYVEVATFNADGTFDVSIKWQAGQFVADDGVIPVTTQLGGFGASGYGLYALFTGNGTFVPDGSGGAVFTFNASADSFSLFADEDNNTTFTQPGNGTTAWTTGNDSDDELVGTGGVLDGGGVLDPTLPTCDPGINCGSFGTTTSLALTAFGSTYFVLPDPFYNVAFESGQFDLFTPEATQVINGSLDVVFENQIPEPTTLALMGLGMAGLGIMRRRKKA